VLATHLLGRPLGRLIDRDNPAEEDENLRPCKLHITCRAKNEARIRALLVQHTSGGGIILRGMHTTPLAPATATGETDGRLAPRARHAADTWRAASVVRAGGPAPRATWPGGITLRVKNG
jgi:hypothetical protein